MRVMRSAGVLVVASLVVSCSPGVTEDVVLVSRTWPDEEPSCRDESVLTCEFSAASWTFRNDSGHRATLQPAEVLWIFVRIDNTEECGGLTMEDGKLAFLYQQTNSAETAGLTLEFDDGSVVRVLVDTMVQFDRRCLELVGRWQGSAGRFRDRSGTFRMLDDSVQVEITLHG